MPSETFEQLLERAASACGIEPEFWDIFGRHHVTTTEARQTILRAQGIAAGNREELEHSLAERARREASEVLPPCVVAGESAEIAFPLQVPADTADAPVCITVKQETGQENRFELNLRDLPQLAANDVEGRTWHRKLVRLPLALPLGYHEVRAELNGAIYSTRYIVTPERAHTDPHLASGGRVAGLSVSLYGVRSPRNWGCGDFSDLRDVIDWVSGELQATFVGLNPLHAIHNRRPFNTSPYLPNSIYYQNFLYLDVEAMEDYARCTRAQKLRASADVSAEIEALRASEFVEYERVAALKLRFLKICFARFLRERRAGSSRAAQFQSFLDQEGELLQSFATYCALDEYLHRRNPDLWNWPDWPAPYQDPDSAETKEFQRKHWRSVLFYSYLQWQIDLQLSAAQKYARERGLSLGLYHDLALATDRFGSDFWAHRPSYVSGCRVGSPPDDFAPQGQDWGFPPPNSPFHRRNGYRLFAESIRRNCRHGGALRIDHVMRLFRLYWIPDQSPATHGAYVRELNEDFVRILALESVRNRVVVVGEDLGTVEPAVRETLARFGILSYRLFYFEKNGGGDFRRYDEYPRQALVSSTTHDLPTLAGFWINADIEARHRAGVLDDASYQGQLQVRAQEKQKMLDRLFTLDLMRPDLPRSAAAYGELTGDLHNAIVGFLALTPSQLLAINQEDLTKEVSQQNLPGTTLQYPNWGRKMRFTIEQLKSDEQARGFAAMFRNWIDRSGRKHSGA